MLRKNYALAYDGRQVRSCRKLSTGTISTTLQCRTVRWCTCLLIVVQQTTRHRFAKTQLMRQDRFDFFHGMVRCSSCARHSSYHVNLNVSIQHWPIQLILKHIETAQQRTDYTAIRWLVHWPLMGGLLHLVHRGGAWAGCGPVQSPPRCTKCNSPPINGQCTNFTLFDAAL